MRILTHEFLWELTVITRNHLDTDECYITGGAVRDMILGKPHRPTGNVPIDLAFDYEGISTFE